MFASAVSLLPKAPSAQEKPTKTGTLADAKAHMDKGQQLFLEKKFEAAAAEFREAYAIRPFSTFLFNEAVCHEKLRNLPEAIAKFRKYTEVDPTAPDIPAVKARIARLEAELAGGGDAGVEGDAGAAKPPPSGAVTIDEMRSIVLIESLPEGAPVEVWQKTDAKAAKFEIGGANPGWTKVASGTTTFTQSLPLGNYHVVLPKFQDYRATETDITVAAATISMFKANLSQGAFYGVMKVRALSEEGEVPGAHVLVKKPGDAKYVDRGVTPYEESLESGAYAIRVEMPGFKPTEQKIDIEHGKIEEHKLKLERSNDGLVRVEVQGADEADVYIDGDPIGTWTLGAKVEKTLPAGTHRVKVKASGRKTWVADVDVPKGRLVVVHTELKPSVSRTAAWTTGIAAVLFIGGGVYLGLESNKLKDELTEAQAAYRLDQEDVRIKRGQYFAIGADACFAAGGLLALISAYSFIRDPLPDSKGYTEKPRDWDPVPASKKLALPSVKVTPTWAPTFAGLSLTGEF